MQIVSATVESMDFYCPVTGHRVISEDDGFTPSSATKGYWVNEVQFEPEISDDDLAGTWQKWLQRNDLEDDLVGAIDFLEDHPAENWVVFALHTKGLPGDTAWVVIDLAGHHV